MRPRSNTKSGISGPAVSIRGSSIVSTCSPGRYTHTLRSRGSISQPNRAPHARYSCILVCESRSRSDEERNEVRADFHIFSPLFRTKRFNPALQDPRRIGQRLEPSDKSNPAEESNATPPPFRIAQTFNCAFWFPVRECAGGITINSPSGERSIRRSRFAAQNALYSACVTRRRVVT